MPANQFESSRVAGGTLNAGAQKLADTSHSVPVESSVISRDDVRDGFVENPPGAGGENRAVSVSALLKYHVKDAAGESLGKIDQMMLDVSAGVISHIVLSIGGFAGAFSHRRMSLN